MIRSSINHGWTMENSCLHLYFVIWPGRTKMLLFTKNRSFHLTIKSLNPNYHRDVFLVIKQVNKYYFTRQSSSSKLWTWRWCLKNYISYCFRHHFQPAFFYWTSSPNFWNSVANNFENVFFSIFFESRHYFVPTFLRYEERSKVNSNIEIIYCLKMK